VNLSLVDLCGYEDIGFSTSLRGFVAGGGCSGAGYSPLPWYSAGLDADGLSREAVFFQGVEYGCCHQCDAAYADCLQACAGVEKRDCDCYLSGRRFYGPVHCKRGNGSREISGGEGRDCVRFEISPGAYWRGRNHGVRRAVCG